jgi:RecA-family ATPase
MSAEVIKELRAKVREAARNAKPVNGSTGPEMPPDAAETGEDGPGGGQALLLKALVRFTADDLSGPPPRQEFVLHPYIPAGNVTTLAGPGGSSKTTFLTALAVHRALGLPFFGCTPRRGRTVIFTTEDGRDDYLRKLAALGHELGDTFDAATVAENVCLFDLAGVPVRLIEADRGNFHPTALADDLAAVLQEHVQGADLVVMETVSRLSGGMESNEALSILVESAQRVCRLASTAVLLAHHTGQDAGRSGSTDQWTPRGGSALGDNGRSTLVLTRLNEHNRKSFAPDADLSREDMERVLVLTHPKSNGCPSAKPMLLERVSTPFGPALRPFLLRPREVDSKAQLERLRAVAEELAAKGLEVTARRLRSYTAELGCSQRQVERLLDDAEAAGVLRRRTTGSRGGGTVYEVVQ